MSDPLARMPRRPRRRLGAKPLSPRHPQFTNEVLMPLVRRHDEGESGAELAAELYDAIHPWALGVARAQNGAVPAHADRDEILSHVLRLAWESCARIDWDRHDTWLSLLESKISRARAEAARSDDWLSRRERVRRRRFQEEVARREQVQRRGLTHGERERLAQAVAPRSERVDWSQAVLVSRHPSTMAQVPEIPTEEGIEAEVEDRAMGGIRGRCLSEWLAAVSQTDAVLADDLTRWSGSHDAAHGSLPARLANRVEPYTPLLLALLSEAA